MESDAEHVWRSTGSLPVLDLLHRPTDALKAQLRDIPVRIRELEALGERVPRVVHLGREIRTRVATWFSWVVPVRTRLILDALRTEEEYLKSELARRHAGWEDLSSNRDGGEKVLGDAFERFVGHSLEGKGYYVCYPGLRRKDAGADLICESDSEIMVIQCKYYKRDREVGREVVRQIAQVADRMRSLWQVGEKFLIPMVVTTSTLTAGAKIFAKKYGVQVNEEVSFAEDARGW